MKDQWVTLTFRIPKEAADVVESEIDRLRTLMEFREEIPEEVKDGLCLEMMAVNSSQISDEEIE